MRDHIAPIGPRRPFPSPYPFFDDRPLRGRFPQWHDIEAPLSRLGLAHNGYRLIPEGFDDRIVEIEGYGSAIFRCEPKQPVAKGRASPHRLKVKCSCRKW